MGQEREDLPMGFWFMYSRVVMESRSPFILENPFIEGGMSSMNAFTDGTRISPTRVLLPSFKPPIAFSKLSSLYPH